MVVKSEQDLRAIAQDNANTAVDDLIIKVMADINLTAPVIFSAFQNVTLKGISSSSLPGTQRRIEGTNTTGLLVFHSTKHAVLSDLLFINSNTLQTTSSAVRVAYGDLTLSTTIGSAD